MVTGLLGAIISSISGLTRAAPGGAVALALERAEVGTNGMLADIADVARLTSASSVDAKSLAVSSMTVKWADSKIALWSRPPIFTGA